MKFYFTFILSLLVICFQKNSSAQSISTFSIIEKGKAENISEYSSALENADMTNYRLLSKRVKIYFENGVIAELFSAKELSEKGVKINLSDFREEFPAEFELPGFSLKDGYIIALYKARGKTTSSEP